MQEGNTCRSLCIKTFQGLYYNGDGVWREGMGLGWKWGIHVLKFTLYMEHTVFKEKGIIL